VLLALAGSAWTAGQAILPDMALDTVARYDVVAANRAAEAWSGALLILAGVLLVLAAISLAHRLPTVPGGRGHRSLVVGIAMLGLGGVWLAAGRGAFNLMFVRLTDSEVPRAAALTVLDASGGVAFVPLLLTLPGLLLGPVLLGWGMHRARLAGWAPLVLWVAGLGVFLASEFTFKVGEIVGIGLASAALVLLGLAAERCTKNRQGERVGVIVVGR
jgi:hypothetical protein